MHAVVTQQANDVPWTSPEDSLKVLTSGTLMGNSEDSQGTNTEIYDLMIKLYSRTIVLVLHTYPCSLLENKYSNVLNGTSARRLRDPVAGRPEDQMIGRSTDVHGTSFKHVFLL